MYDTNPIIYAVDISKVRRMHVVNTTYVAIIIGSRVLH